LADRGRPFRLVYASGRFCASLRRSIAEKNLPRPDALIGGVGTEIELPQAPLAGWPPLAGGWRSARVREALRPIDFLRPQPAELCSEFKISYYGEDLTAGQLAEISDRLEQAGVGASLIYSSHRDVDIVPRGVDKGSAAKRLARRWGIAPQRLVVAGDSGNDLSLFREAAHGIVVANACPELRALARGQGDARVFLARRPFAFGVVDGLEFFAAHYSEWSDSGSTCRSWQALR
jgi:sucrose-6F-phosphate phosphohydrolase